MAKYIIFFVALLLVFCCTTSLVYSQAVPDYASLDAWAAHPKKEDPSDRVPDARASSIPEDQKVDVFFLHPTTYTKGKPKEAWNGDVYNEELRAKTNEGTILHQASIFNGVGQVYAPFYRQAHIYSYYTDDKARSKLAFELAYQDVEKAFMHFLKNENKGRPIIIAAHSQGTNHAERLLKEYFDQDSELRNRLVAAYLVGMPISKNTFINIKVCENAEETRCFCSWRTFKQGHFPKKYALGDSIAVTNPISWLTSKDKVEKSRNKGSILRKFEDGFVPGLVGAQVSNGVLWVNKPKFPGSFLLVSKNYHIADFNLFYHSVRENTIARVDKYHKKQK